MLTNIAQDIARYKEAKRAKKLLFYVTQKYWENDWNILNQYSWESLLENLYENNPTIDDLKAVLYHAVNSLNRKEAYSKISKYILQRMLSLYEENYSQVLNKDDNQINQFDTELIDKIVENIENHEEAPRMKKLIFAGCKQYWENDIDMIDVHDMRELIRELRQLYPNTKKLRKALDKVVSSINRQNFYSFIADTIVGELTYLYKYDPVQGQNDSEEEDTRLILSKKAPSPPLKTTDKVYEPDKKTQAIIDEIIEEENSIEPVTSNLVVPWLKVDNLFDLKQEIMQYTNPLRAKVILFYAIYQIDTNEQHWSVVRTCTLEDLLISMFQRYSHNVQKIETELMVIAQSRIEGLEPEDNVQAVNAIIKAVKHFNKRS